MKIYTKTGDQGTTGLFGGPRVWKDDSRIAAYGDVDELNSVIGVVRAESPPSAIDALLERIQHELFALGSELATPDPAARGTALLTDAHVAALEVAIDQHEATLTPLRQFILPGGSRVAALLHLARTVCRRAEREIVALSRQPGVSISERLIRYTNRLSDLLFVLARAANASVDHPDIAWQKPVSQ